MKKAGLRTLTFMGAMFISGAAFAADCTTDKAKDDLTGEEVTALYECIKEELRAGYASGDNPWAKEYVSWGPTASRPAAPGAHGKRFLNTTANETALAEYLKFSDERGPMPVGSVLAKESFSVTKKGKVKAGPLFFMEKVAAGTADEFDNWVYSAVQPKGKVMKIKQGFCHACHDAFSDQDNIGLSGRGCSLDQLTLWRTLRLHSSADADRRNTAHDSSVVCRFSLAVLNRLQKRLSRLTVFMPQLRDINAFRLAIDYPPFAGDHHPVSRMRPA